MPRGRKPGRLPRLRGMFRHMSCYTFSLLLEATYPNLWRYLWRVLDTGDNPLKGRLAQLVAHLVYTERVRCLHILTT